MSSGRAASIALCRSACPHEWIVELGLVFGSSPPGGQGPDGFGLAAAVVRLGTQRIAGGCDDRFAAGFQTPPPARGTIAARQDTLQRRLQLVEASIQLGRNADHGDAERTRQPLEIDPDARGLGGVEHVDRNQCWQAQLQDRNGQVEVALKIGRVDDCNDRVRRWGARSTAERLEENRFVAASGYQRIGARKVDDGERRAVDVSGTRPAFDGDSGIVADLLAKTGEPVEQRGLAAVRIAGECDYGHATSSRSTSRPSASLRRIDRQ